jgi:hypothetical protein
MRSTKTYNCFTGLRNREGTQVVYVMATYVSRIRQHEYSVVITIVWENVGKSLFPTEYVCEK